MTVASKQKATPKKAVCQPKFLRAYAQLGNVSAACREAGIERTAYYRWREEDPEFAAACQMASEESADHLESVAWKRAEETSDTLLIFLLKGLRPQKYRETYRHEVSGPDGESLKVYVQWSPEDEV